MTIPTGRKVLAGLSAAGLAVPALTVLPAVAEAQPDAELFRTVHEFDTAKPAWVQADKHNDHLCALAHKEHPEPPRSISREITRVDGSKAFIPRQREDIEATWWGRDEERNGRWKQARLAERDTYDAACKVIDERYGVPEAKARNEAALTKYTAAEERVYRTPAKTAEGIAAKLRVAIQENEYFDFNPEPFELILADAERLGRAT